MKLRRRDLLILAGASGAAILGARYITGDITSTIPKTPSIRTKEVTPNDEFYITHINGVPEVDIANWRLKIEGGVERELSLGIDDLKTLDSSVDYNTLICIGNGIGGDLIGNALWRGVRLADILEMSGAQPNARDIVLHGADGYLDSFPIERALHRDTRLVYEMNGEALSPAHGFPLRAVVPGLYGIKNVKWIERIEVSSDDVRGYWQKRGWSEEGVIKVMSRIDLPREGERLKTGDNRISGIAFGGEHPISKVEVSTDGGANWEDALIKPSLSRYAWTLWQYNWRIPGPGSYEISVRATDESGRLQKEGTVVSRRVFPDGADGYHKIMVTAE